MVSRFLVASCRLARISLLVCLLSLLVFPPTASARNPYTIRDGHEGDPGDGVLNPAPVQDPDPTPKDDLIPLFTLRMIPVGGQRFIAVYQFTSFRRINRPAPHQTGFQLVTDWRWHRAP